MILFAFSLLRTLMLETNGVSTQVMIMLTASWIHLRMSHIQ